MRSTHRFAVALLAPVLLLSGCTKNEPDQPRATPPATQPATPQPPDTDEPPTSTTPAEPAEPGGSVDEVRLVVTADFSGGLCEYGACEAHVSVRSDGSWTSGWGPEKSAGQLTRREQEVFWAAVVNADLTGTPKDERVCNAWTDGMDVEVSLEPETQQRVFASSCDYDLSSEPLLDVLTDLALNRRDSTGSSKKS